ncbi:MAG: hypothetical protein DWQ44_11255 [Bacteroidetes bacterium]|nr:MAG: hypothetical protein DWQ33_09375 [Bacteroidota bacterium]REK05199.1 MAG: hypothetical protein DWQ39_08385 [Bacteroidota bacterium]REK32604.1 MAG: hypothetical protein DWQ44_11255 [Bacteroidota bacterium]REK48949.1 MAG: hypothetical protein DWQ48_08705 [Bacteroidota bacterium]
MKKNLYYRQNIGRQNMLKSLILSYFFTFSSWPRLLLEVFIRKNFGERYFTLSSAVTVFSILFLLPGFLQISNVMFQEFHFGKFMAKYASWYVFLFLFLRVSLKHNRDKKRNPSVFDFAKFSLYAGEIDPRFYRLKIPFRKSNPRTVEIFSEPLIFFLGGIGLYLLAQPLGMLLIVCSLFYSLGYAGAYHIGDNFVMDKIDEMICNEELEDSFVNDKDPSETRGFRFYGKKPNDQEMRRKVASLMTVDEEIYEAR